MAALVVLLLALACTGGLYAVFAPAGKAQADDTAQSLAIDEGKKLFSVGCASCHGTDGRGVSAAPQHGAAKVPGLGPSLRGVGALAVDFYLRTGYMPLGNPHEQPSRGPALFDRREQAALTRYIASLAKGPPNPAPHPERGSLSEGLQLFTEHCAGCHQVVGEGGIVTGARVPALDKASVVEIAEAVRVGPYFMPRFTHRDLNDAQLNSIIRYVRYATQRPDDPGGWAIDHLGPFPEGMVAWLLGGLSLVLVCMLIGKRLRS